MEKQERINNLYKVQEKINDCMALVCEATDGTIGQDFIKIPIIESLTLSMKRVTNVIKIASLR